MASPPDGAHTHHHPPGPLSRPATPKIPTARQLSTSSTASTASVSSQSSSSSTSSASGPTLSTPVLPHTVQLPSSPHAHPFPSPNSSPEGSPASTAHSKGECTPRAEIEPPLWPLAAASPRRSASAAAASAVYSEPLLMRGDGDEAPEASLSRASSLKRAISWRKKHASLDTPSTGPHHSAFPDLTSFTEIPPLAQPPHTTKHRHESTPAQPRSTFPPPTNALYLRDPRRASADSRFSSTSAPSAASATPRTGSSAPSSSSSGLWARSRSPATGCEISAPKPPPAGYPLAPFSSGGMRRNSSSSGLAPPASSAASIASSSSGNSANSLGQSQSQSQSHIHSNGNSPNSSNNPLTPPPPRWACPPAVTDSYSGRAQSFGSGSGRPADVSLGDDFDPELFEGQEDEWIEVIKGAEGRIAIKSTPMMYDIMVWLPGFSIDNITIATRGTRTIHIVADQWDEGDHAQWDIKLGEDANLKSVNAKFTGKELRVTVAREQSEYQRASKMRSSAASARSAPQGVSGPSITTTTKPSPLERATARAPVAPPASAGASTIASTASAAAYPHNSRI